MFKKIFLSSILASSLMMAGNIEVKDAYVRAVPPNMPNSIAYMKIINHSNKVIYLKSADSTVAKNLELHRSTMEKGMMVMRQVPNIKISAHSFTMLKPDGFHIMIVGLKRHIEKHGVVKEMNLYFSNGKKITLQNVPVKSVMSGMNMKKMK